MKIIDNQTVNLRDELKNSLEKGSKVSIAAACFSIYAFEELKEQLQDVQEFRFLFTTPAFIDDIAKASGKKKVTTSSDSAKKAESELGGTELENCIQKAMMQRAIAKECAEWINQGKVKFRAVSGTGNNANFAVVKQSAKGKDTTTFAPIHGFTTIDLGCEKDGNSFSLIQELDTPYSTAYLEMFEKMWEKQDNIKDNLLNRLTRMFEENSPEIIYYTAIYNIFNEFLKDISDDDLANEITADKRGVWGILYDFQRDAALAIINKLDRYNGCILADSVGLGKTFTALAVIKYYEMKNKSVLVLCPKKLADNWNLYRQLNNKSNILKADKFTYDVFYHTDLTRMNDARAESNGQKLAQINWQYYDLVVIDESHNFRNGSRSSNYDGKQNRYELLRDEIIRKGVNTKVLMLSATPVNNRFNDLKNQLELAYEDGDPKALESKLDIRTTIQGIFNKAQNAYNIWSKAPEEARTTDKLLQLLDFDFFELLDSVTIARSRKHIREYYDMNQIGAFPTRLSPLSLTPELTEISEDGDYDYFFESLLDLNLSIYTPSQYILPDKRTKYADKSGRVNASINQENRESGLRRLMAINLMKRMESSIQSFRLTLERMHSQINAVIRKIDNYRDGSSFDVTKDLSLSENNDMFDYEDAQDDCLTVGKTLKIELADMNLSKWRSDLKDDIQIIEQMLFEARKINVKLDNKLKELKKLIAGKQLHQINEGNKKVLIFTAFADTADYLFENIKDYCRSLGLNCAVLTGSSAGKTTIPQFPCDFNTILTCFSPISKGREQAFEEGIIASSNIDVLIGTDCISEGQNLQDCDVCVNYDIHWNPIRIIQRYGRIDRIGSHNQHIQLVNFWPNASLDKYIDLKRRVESRMKMASIVGGGAEGKELSHDEEVDLKYRRTQLEKLKNEVVDFEDISENISITDLGLNEFRLDLLGFEKNKELKHKNRFGVHAVVPHSSVCPPGVIFVLKNTSTKTNIKTINRLHPFYLIYIGENGHIINNYMDSKEILVILKKLCRSKEPIAETVEIFNHDTQDGRNMTKYTHLLEKAIESIVEQKKENDIMDLFKVGGTNFNNKIEGVNDFKLICYLVVK